MLQGRGNNTTNSNILTSQKSMGERSKTLGPGFMRGHHHNNTVVLLNYHNAADHSTTYIGLTCFFPHFLFYFPPFWLHLMIEERIFFLKKDRENVACGNGKHFCDRNIRIFFSLKYIPNICIGCNLKKSNCRTVGFCFM